MDRFFSTNGAGPIGHPEGKQKQKQNFSLNLTFYMKISSK
jgi:hypothetical protein